MSYPEPIAKMRELSAAALAMGALGAELRLRRQSGTNADPRTRATLQGIVNSFDPHPAGWDRARPSRHRFGPVALRPVFVLARRAPA
jgi:hypothetical protein